TRGGAGGSHGDDRHVETELLRTAAQEIRISGDIERRNIKLGAPPPNGQREVGTDARRLTERQGQRLHVVVLPHDQWSDNAPGPSWELLVLDHRGVPQIRQIML